MPNRTYWENRRERQRQIRANMEHRPVYTEKEEKELKDLYLGNPFLPVKEIAKRLDRSVQGIRSKVSRMGLSRYEVIHEIMEGEINAND